MTLSFSRGFQIFAVIFLSFVLVFTAEMPSFAFGGGTGHDSEGSGGGFSDPPGTGGGGNSSGGDGGGGSPPDPPPATYKTSSETSWSSGTARSWGCAAVSASHNGQGVVGATKTRRARVWQDYVGGPWYSDTLWENVVCHYPPAWRETSVTCVVSSNARIERVYPARNTIQNITKNSAYASNRTLSNCLNSDQWINVNATPNLYGHWEANGSTVVDRCQWRQYTTADPRTGATPGDELRGCSRTTNVNPFHAKGTLTCRGWTDGRHLTGYSFTEDDCKTTSVPNNLKCNVGGAPTTTWDGNRWKGTSVQVLRNGGNVDMKWDTPSISGSGLQSVVSTRSRLAVANAPWSKKDTLTQNWFGLQKTGSSKNALKDQNGTAWKSGLDTKWTAQWYQPTTVATKVTPHYGFTADFRKTTVRITGVHTDGSWRTTTSTTTVRADATCSAPPLNVTSLRVINGVG